MANQVSMALPRKANDSMEVEDHPNGDEIRRQVEYYFSDDNLPNDAHLLAKCGGHENRPVSIKSICGFPRMRKYKPVTLVVSALRLSTELEVVDDNFIRRQQPFTLPLQVKPEEKEVEKLQVLSQDGVTKGLLKPTGFEEYYTDPPITPEVYAHERDIYDTQYAFSDRIEKAVQRYVARRKFHNDTRRIFDGWMKFGGIDARPRIAGQLSREEMESMTAEDIGEIMAVHFCHEDVADDTKFTIDIEGVVKAFFSSYAPIYMSVDIDTPVKIEKATNILRNFFNYILAHDVAPDYAVCINAARGLCTRARVELTGIYHLRELLRGSFNVACSVLHGVDREKVKSGAGAEWGEEFRFKPAFSDETARVIIKTGIAAQGTEAQFEAATNNKSLDFIVVEELTRGFEVISITPAESEAQALYAHKELSGLPLQPLGKLVLKPWVEPDFASWDLPADLTPDHPDHPDYISDETYTLWLEDPILQHFHLSPLTTYSKVPRSSTLVAATDVALDLSKPRYLETTRNEGTKLVATIKKLRLSPADDDNKNHGLTAAAAAAAAAAEGIWFLDSFTKLHPSFYAILPNELMRGYKKPAPHRRLFEAFDLHEDEVDENGQIRAMPANREAVSGLENAEHEGAVSTNDAGDDSVDKDVLDNQASIREAPEASSENGNERLNAEGENLVPMYSNEEE